VRAEAFGWWIIAALACCASCGAPDKPTASGPDQAAAENTGGKPAIGNRPPSDAHMPDGPRALYVRPGQAPKGLHPTERFLYWSENTFADGPRVFRAPKNGGREPQAISDTETVSSLGFITSDAEFVYWVEAERIVRMAHESTERKDIVLPLKLWYPFLSRTGDFLYAGDLGCGHVVRVNKNTFDVTVLRSVEEQLPGGATIVVSDGTWVYCSTGTNGSVLAIPTTGGEAKTIVQLASDYHAIGMVLVGDQLFLLQVPKGLGQRGHSILRVSTAGGTPETLVTADTYGGGSLLLYDEPHDALFWLDAVGAPGTIFRYALQPAELTRVVENRKLDGALAIDADHVYFGELEPAGITVTDL
jgi:hypothetical protein